MWEDEIVKEVREVRDKIAQEADYNMNTLYEQALALQSRLDSELVSEPVLQPVPVLSKLT